MKRLYVILFVVIAAAALLGVAIAEHSGYVLVAYKNFRYEAGLWVTLALVAVLWLVWRGLRALIGLVTTSSGVAVLFFTASGFSVMRPADCSSSRARLPLDGSFWMPTVAPSGSWSMDLILRE